MGKGAKVSVMASTQCPPASSTQEAVNSSMGVWVTQQAMQAAAFLSYVDPAFLTNFLGLIACADYIGWVGNHYPSDKFMQLSCHCSFVLPRSTKTIPLISASIYFVDESSLGFAAYWTMQNHQNIVTHGLTAQWSELVAVVTVLEYTLAESLNI